MRSEELKKVVKEGYAQIAKQDDSCCYSVPSCCGNPDRVQSISKAIGYSNEEMDRVPAGANLGLGCGNPVALASLKEGDTVLDLGSGAGFDCFLAADQVGTLGKVIGVDMTPEMIAKATANARESHYGNVEFRLGEIENLPLADCSVDVVLSNCVINLSPEKARVFQEAFRVLKPGGKMVISDIVLLQELPKSIRNSLEAYIGCLSGAIQKDDYLRTIQESGFQDVTLLDETTFPVELMANDPTARVIMETLKVPAEMLETVARSVTSIKVSGVKPDMIV